MIRDSRCLEKENSRLFIGPPSCFPYAAWFNPSMGSVKYSPHFLSEKRRRGGPEASTWAPKSPWEPLWTSSWALTGLIMNQAVNTSEYLLVPELRRL